MRLLEEFWYGNIESTEYCAPSSKECHETQELISRNEEKLLASEIIDMVVRNGDNCSMLRLIGNYIEKEKVTDLPKSIEMALYRATKAGACEVKAFDDFVHLSSMGLGHQDGSYLHVWRRLDEYEAAAKTALDKAKPYISEEELKAVEAAEITRETNFQPFTI